MCLLIEYRITEPLNNHEQYVSYMLSTEHDALVGYNYCSSHFIFYPMDDLFTYTQIYIKEFILLSTFIQLGMGHNND